MLSNSAPGGLGGVQHTSLHVPSALRPLNLGSGSPQELGRSSGVTR